MTTPAYILRILDPTGEESPSMCSGPSADGACPVAATGGPVPCAGHQLVPAHGDAPGTARVVVPAGADECPVPMLMVGGG